MTHFNLQDGSQVDEVSLEALAEMFPHENALRIRKSLLIANGDVDAAAQLLLQDDVAIGSDELLLNSTQMAGQKKQVDEKTLRDQIINRYIQCSSTIWYWNTWKKKRSDNG